MHDFGSVPVIPHILTSSRKDSWNVGLEWSEIPSRVYAGVEGSTEDDDSETYVVQMVDKLQ